MKIGPIVIKLRIAETVFDNKIAGVAELAAATRVTLNNEQAFVIPLSETSTANDLDNGINQTITESFGVVVALKTDDFRSDKTALTATDRLHDIRAQIFKAILGWQMPDAESVISYNGGTLLEINKAWLWYQFEFSSDMRIDIDDGIEQEDLPLFERIWAQYIIEDGQKYESIDDIINAPDNRLPADPTKVDAEQQIEE